MPIEEGATIDPGNINKHTARGRALVENSLQRRGAFRSIASAGKNVKTPVVYAGNLTLETAVEAGFKEIVNVHVRGDQIVNVVRDDIEPGSPEAVALGLEDNESAAKSYNPDIDILAALAAGDNALLAALRKEDKVFNGMLEGMGVRDEPQDAEPQFDKADALREKWGVTKGSLWKIAEHRLLCGDSTNAEDIARVMGGEKAQLMVTDPPYGVDYHGNFIQSGKILKEEEKIWEDGIENDESSEILSSLQSFSSYLQDGAGILVCAPPGRKLFDFLKYWPANWHFQVALVWNKQSLIISRWDYHPQHEMILYGWKDGAAHKWNGGTKQSTVWDIPRHQGAGYDHPTEKPIDIYMRAISNHSDAGNVVFEPFCGSGTAITACQNLGRKCRAIEISEAYTAVCLQRMADAFPGISIERIE